MPATPQIADFESAPSAAFVRGQLPQSAVDVVERVHRRFLHALEEELSNDLTIPVRAAFLGSSPALFSDVLEAAGVGGSLHTLDLLPQKNHAVLAFPPALLLSVLDILLFAPASDGERRESVTPIELHILRNYFDMVLSSLRAAWATVCPVSLESTSPTVEDARECIGRFKNDGAMVLRASLTIGEVSGEFTLAIPSFLARHADMKVRRDSAPEIPPAAVQDRIRGVVRDSKLKVEAVLQGSKIRMRDLVGLKPGEILLSGHRAGADFACLVNGKPRFIGDLTPSNGRYGFAVAAKTEVRPS